MMEANVNEIINADECKYPSSIFNGDEDVIECIKRIVLDAIQ